MIQRSLSFIVNQVNEYLSQKVGETPVVLNALVDQKGDIQISDDEVACTLVSLEEERVGKSQVAYEVVNGVSTAKKTTAQIQSVYSVCSKSEAIDDKY